MKGGAEVRSSVAVVGNRPSTAADDKSFSIL